MLSLRLGLRLLDQHAYETIPKWYAQSIDHSQLWQVGYGVALSNGHVAGIDYAKIVVSVLAMQVGQCDTWPNLRQGPCCGMTYYSGRGLHKFFSAVWNRLFQCSKILRKISGAARFALNELGWPSRDVLLRPVSVFG